MSEEEEEEELDEAALQLYCERVWGEQGELADKKLLKVHLEDGDEGLVEELKRRFLAEKSKGTKRKAEAGPSGGPKKRGRPKGSKNKPKA